MDETAGDHGMEIVDLRFESLRDLQEEFGPFLSPEGFFLRDRSDFDVSDVLRFRLMLPGDFVLIEGVGVVVWVRGRDEATEISPVGAAIGFATLSDQGRELVERIVHSNVEGGGQPFDMTRPADNGNDAGLPDEKVDSPKVPDGMKFTIREDPSVAGGEATEVNPGEPSLPFDEGVLSNEGSDEYRDTPDPQGDQRVAEEPGESGVEEGPDEEVRIDSAQAEVEEPAQLAFSVDLPGPGEDGDGGLLEPSGALDVSLPHQMDSADGVQRSWVDEQEEFGDPPEKKGHSVLVGIVIGLIVLGAGLWAVWTQYPEFFPWSEESSAEVVAEEPVPTALGARQPESVDSLSDEDLEAVVEAAVEAVTDPDNVTDSERIEPEKNPSEGPEAQVSQPEVSVQPTPVPATAGLEPIGHPATRVVDIQTDGSERGTAILIRTNGSIETSRVRTSSLDDPPRILVRIFGIDGGYRPYRIAVGSPEITSIRVGHHQETRPPSLWIVLDREDTGVEIVDVQTSGNVLRVEVGR